MKQYQYVCMFEKPKDAKPFKKFLTSSDGTITNLEDVGHTICFIGPKAMLALVERYKLPEGITLQVERRPAGSDPDDAEAEGTVESYAYYGSE